MSEERYMSEETHTEKLVLAVTRDTQVKHPKAQKVSLSLLTYTLRYVGRALSPHLCHNTTGLVLHGGVTNWYNRGFFRDFRDKLFDVMLVLVYAAFTSLSLSLLSLCALSLCALSLSLCALSLAVSFHEK